MKMQIKGGATLWARQTMNSKIFLLKPDKWFKIWFYIVNVVNFKDTNNIKKGTSFLKYSWIIDKTGATKNQVKHCIKFLKKEGMIATQKATGGFVCEVINYNTFQSLESYKKQYEKENKSHTKPPKKPHKWNRESFALYQQNQGAVKRIIQVFCKLKDYKYCKISKERRYKIAYYCNHLGVKYLIDDMTKLIKEKPQITSIAYFLTGPTGKVCRWENARILKINQEWKKQKEAEQKQAKKDRKKNKKSIITPKWVDDANMRLSELQRKDKPTETEKREFILLEHRLNKFNLE